MKENIQIMHILFKKYIFFFFCGIILFAVVLDQLEACLLLNIAKCELDTLAKFLLSKFYEQFVDWSVQKVI